MSQKQYPWFRRMLSDADALDDIVPRYLKAAMRVESYLMQFRPPLKRSDHAWIRISGLKSKNSLETCFAHLSEVGFIILAPDGSVSSVFAEREWAYREEISKQKSENRRGLSGGKSTTEPMMDAELSNQKFANNQLPTATAVEQPRTDLEERTSEEENKSDIAPPLTPPPLPVLQKFPSKSGRRYSELDTETIREKNRGVCASPELRRLTKKS